ncbi:RNA-splicing ligase RtcB, partial [Candidatus Pacearchaeota archaeon CG09_land_8_20_14_0_10_30_9]
MKKEDLKKIGENIYEIAKSGNMNVPGRIFISERMIVEDNASEQIRNVAQLPGILKYSIGLTDMHVGYGFPIGGVAAFDLKKGVISPGGVGYDINCLTGDSKILTEFGQSIPIKDFEKHAHKINIEQNGMVLDQIEFLTRLPTLNFKNKKIENKKIEFFMSKEANEIYEIKLNSGLRIKATKEHPFLTKEGMKSIFDLKDRENLAVNLFEGIKESEIIDKKQAISLKLLGYMFGDGCLYESKKKIYGAIYGTKEDLKVIKNDLKEINVNSNIYSRKRDHEIKTKYEIVKFNTTNYELHIHSKEFKESLKKMGMPLGNKTRQKINIPDWIKNSNRIVKRLFLAGFFGAELSSPKASSKTCFYCPTIDQNKIERLKENAREFLIEISLLLEEFDIKNTRITETEDYKNKYGEKTMRFRLMVSSEEEMLKLWRNVGFEYNLKRQKLANIAALYLLLKKKENEKRNKLASKVKEYKKKGFSLKEVQKIFLNQINKRFIERHYYENSGQRINLDFISFNKFLIEKLNEIKKYGTIFDSIKNIKKLPGKHKVYDFNLKENHNFVANGFIVSNCGVLLLKTNLTSKDLIGKEKMLADALEKKIPSGVGRGSPFQVSYKEFDQILEKGSQYLVEKGYGMKEDYLFCEEEGCMKEADASLVSDRAKKRGIGQLGTIGAGNHFLDVLEVEKIFDKKIAEVFGLKKNQIVILVHCGSRGLGHQVASDYIKKMEDEYGIKNFPDRELICAPINSKLGKE